MRQNRR